MFTTVHFETILKKQSLPLPLRAIEIAPRLRFQAEILLRDIDMPERLLLVADDQTYTAMGELIEAELTRHFDAKPLLLGKEVRPDEATVELMNKHAIPYGGIVAIGSGTINDLCKRVSYLQQKPYAVFGTAPSMNGYASANASILVKERRTSLPGHLPQGIFLDSEVLARAPMRLILSGLGDSVARSTAQADWLLSHLFFNTPYSAIPYALIAEFEPKLFKDSENLASRDINAIELLAALLIISGLGMYFAGGSQPASQGEHMLAHYMEWMDVHAPQRFHGEMVGVTTLTMARLQEKMLAKPFTIEATELDEWAIMKHFGPELGPEYIEESRQKAVRAEDAREINRYLEENWPIFKKQFTDIMLPARYLEEVLLAAGALTTPKALGWNEGIYANALKYSKFMRNRWGWGDVSQ